MSQTSRGIRLDLLEEYALAPVIAGTPLERLVADSGCQLIAEAGIAPPILPSDGLPALQVHLYEFNPEDGIALAELLNALGALKLVPASRSETVVAMAKYPEIAGLPVLCLEGAKFVAPAYSLLGVERRSDALTLVNVQFEEPLIWGHYLCCARRP